MPMGIELVKAGVSGKLQVTQNLLVQVWFCDRVKRRKIVVKSGLLGLMGWAAREMLQRFRWAARGVLCPKHIRNFKRIQLFRHL